MPEQNKPFIPDIDEQPQSEGLAAVAIHEVEEQDVRNYRISFEHYIEKDCEIKFLEETSQCKKALEWLKQAGKCSDEDGIKSIAKNLSDDAPVYNDNWYGFLFKKLPEDVETIREYKLSNKKGRLFYYTDPAIKMVYCILIKNAHIETDKVKR